MVTPVSTVMGPTDKPFSPVAMVYDADAVDLFVRIAPPA
jgi:hypothetical protein